MHYKTESIRPMIMKACIVHNRITVHEYVVMVYIIRLYKLAGQFKLVHCNIMHTI